MAAAAACATAATLLQPRLQRLQLLHAPGQLLPQPQQRPLHAPRQLRLSAAAAIARAPRQLLPQPWQQPLHAVDLTPEQTSDGAALWRLASRHACCARFISPSAACTTSRRLHKDSTASLPQSQPPLHLARGYIRYAMGYFRLRKQLWDCSQLHLPCRRDHPSVRCREGWRELHDGAAEQQSSSNRCDVRRCTVRNSSARPIYPGNS